jgi:hypothetical protein
MMNHLRWSFALLLALVIGTLAAWSVSRPPSARAEALAPDNEPLPVEKDMHEFMEYVFQPTYKRLKQTMAAEPADNNGWKGMKADALTLAEGGNLLLFRTPTDDASEWAKHSVAVREAGELLYQSAKKKEFAAARQHYEVMIQKCNACHQQFAGGEHILAP